MNMRTFNAPAFFFGLVLACTNTKVNSEQASEVVKHAASMTSREVATDPAMLSKMLFQSCSEIDDCASGNCKKSLRAIGGEGVDPAQRVTLLAYGCSEFKKAHDSNNM